MTDKQIDTMLEMHRYLIKCEEISLIHRINKDYTAEKLQNEINNRHWEDFGNWLRKIRDE